MASLSAAPPQGIWIPPRQIAGFGDGLAGLCRSGDSALKLIFWATGSLPKLLKKARLIRLMNACAADAQTKLFRQIG